MGAAIAPACDDHCEECHFLMDSNIMREDTFFMSDALDIAAPCCCKQNDLTSTPN